MSEPLDHHGPIEGMCFLGLNFTHEQFAAISSAIVERMDPKAEHGVEGAIVSAFAENARLRGVIEEAATRLDMHGGNGAFCHEEKEMFIQERNLLLAALSPQPVQGGGE